MAGTLACNAYTNYLMGSSWEYQRWAMNYQAAALVQDADLEEDAEALASINRFFDVQACRELSNVHGPALRDVICRNDGEVTQEDWSDCTKALVKLALKYPGSLLRERLGVFLNTVEQRKSNSNQKIVFATTVLVYTDEPDNMRENQKDFLYNSIGAYPLNQQLRKTSS